jgi:hypothetical protein
MGWEQRNGKRYYYRKIRQGRRVISEYVGAGEVAESLLELDQFDRAQKTYFRSIWKDQKVEVTNLDKNINQLGKVFRSMTRASLLTSGYHPHKGQWRRTRNG